MPRMLRAHPSYGICPGFVSSFYPRRTAPSLVTPGLLRRWFRRADEILPSAIARLKRLEALRSPERRQLVAEPQTLGNQDQTHAS
jgi:hypothetical protein